MKLKEKMLNVLFEIFSQIILVLYEEITIKPHTYQSIDKVL